MVSCFFKVTVFVGFALAIWDFVTDFMAAYEFYNLILDYEGFAHSIAEGKSGDGPSNFKADSDFFSTLMKEYVTLSDFDKDYVYCDIGSIQSDPDSLKNQSWNILYASGTSVALSLFAIAIGYYILCKLIKSGDMYNDDGDSSGRQKLWNFNAKTVIQFCEDGPQLALLWLMIMRHGRKDGYVCQEKFYNCGTSGDCTMADLMVPVALNSSLVDLALTDILLAMSFVTGLGNVIWNFGSGAYLWLSFDAPRLLILPCMQLSMTALPLLWVVYTDGIMHTDRTASTEGIIVVCVATTFSLCLFCSWGLMIYLGNKNGGAFKVHVDPVTRLRTVSSTVHNKF